MNNIASNRGVDQSLLAFGLQDAASVLTSCANSTACSLDAKPTQYIYLAAKCLVYFESMIPADDVSCGELEMKERQGSGNADGKTTLMSLILPHFQMCVGRVPIPVTSNFSRRERLTLYSPSSDLTHILI